MYGLLLAGGLGIRTKSAVPKQFTRQNSCTVLSIAANNLLIGGCDKIVICVPSAHLETAHEIINAELTAEQVRQIIIIAGGVERIDSIRIGIEKIYINREKMQPSTTPYQTPGHEPTLNEPILIIHDAARPFVPASDIQRLIREFTNTPRLNYIQYITPLTGGLVFIPSTTPDGGSDKVVNRNDYFELVTPSIIHLQLAISILADPEFGAEFIPLLQKIGFEYKLITPADPGLYRKLTWPSDLAE